MRTLHWERLVARPSARNETRTFSAGTHIARAIRSPWGRFGTSVRFSTSAQVTFRSQPAYGAGLVAGEGLAESRNGGERDLHVRRGSVWPWGNASPTVQRPACRVTTSDEDEGLANAVERFVLP